MTPCNVYVKSYEILTKLVSFVESSFSTEKKEILPLLAFKGYLINWLNFDKPADFCYRVNNIRCKKLTILGFLNEIKLCMYSIMKPFSSWFLETAGEVDGSGVSGFHNWFHWYLEEQKGKTTVHQPNI
jgi:hypothetical protein